MTSSWKKYKLNDLVYVIGGGTPKRGNLDYWNGDIPWISIKDFNNTKKIFSTQETITELGLNKSSTKMLKKNDLIISARGTVGLIAQLDKPMAFNQSCYGLDSREMTTNDFIYYWLKQNVTYVKANTHGSVFDTITKETFNNLIVTLPDLETQKEISKILNVLDEKLILNNQIISTLEELASTLFKRWFVDFEFPDENGNPYKSSGGEMVESELGEIPEGWRIKKLDEIAQIQNGYAFKSKDYIEHSINNSVKVLRTLNISSNNLSINNKDLAHLPGEFLELNSNVILNKFDTLLVMVGATIGKVGLVTDINLPSLQNQNMWRFRSILPHLSPVILRHYVIQSRNIAENWKTGSAREFYRKDSFKNITLVVAEDKALDKLNRILLPIYELVNQKNYEINQLEDLRNLLLPKLLSGEIEIPQGEEM